jgi:hypothetical protein
MKLAASWYAVIAPNQAQSVHDTNEQILDVQDFLTNFR